MFRRSLTALAVLTLVFLAQASAPPSFAQSGNQVAIFAGGCFWCVESDFDKVAGVVSTTSGYIGGSAETAKYKTVSNGGTGHYEAVKIVFDPKKVSYTRLLHIFWRSVDPTDPGGQFCDRGSSYKTGIFATTDKHLQQARASKKKAQKALGRTIVTPIRKAGRFFAAEGYHQNYYARNPVRYNVYRYGCGRDNRIKALWGSQAMAGIKH